MSDGRPTTELDNAYAAVENARAVRAFHRRRTERGSLQREQDLAVALERIRDAMTPIRSMIGTFPLSPQQGASVEEWREEVREASLALQAERRKLWKMQHRPIPGLETP